ncbi:hypothetical protein HMPREF1573_01020 [Gardnerella vaginalis JCP7276]|nr:hypothetical protein HMPREF1573_01020 [Gardnerella vaginalis JCP7276]
MIFCTVLAYNPKIFRSALLVENSWINQYIGLINIKSADLFMR